MVKKLGKSVPSTKSVRSAKSAKSPVPAQESKTVARKKPAKLSSSRNLFINATKLIWANRKLFFGVAVVYGLLNFLFQGQGLLSGDDISGLKSYFGEKGGLSTGIGVFAQIIGASGSASSGAASTMQFFLMVIVSLALIWSLRQVLSGHKVTIREAYYRSTSPLIPFLIVLCVVAVQLLPFLIGTSLYNTVIANGIAVHVIEKVIWGLVCLSLSLASFYLISSSLIALYIVTLPDMTPLQALRSAKQLVKNRRWSVLRKVVVLPIIIFILAALIIIPVIMWLTPLTQFVFFTFTMLSFVVIHAYMYTLYRELLNE
jgi:hypothetical protein